MPTPGQLQRWKSHQKQTRVKGAYRIANAEREALASYDSKEHGSSWSKYQYGVQKFYSEKRKLHRAGVAVNV